MNNRIAWRSAAIVFLSCVSAAAGSFAQTVTTLAVFTGASGSDPTSSLVQSTDGNVYGTTNAGGIASATCGGPKKGRGTIFKITPTGTLTTLHKFTGESDGWGPHGGLVLAANGDFYGTIYSCHLPSGCGTIFTITPAGDLTTLYDFCTEANCPDGASVNAGLVQASNGDFYGTTSAGGASASNPSCAPSYSSGNEPGCGTIFKITPSGTLTTLYSFCTQTDCPDGSIPYTDLVRAASGDFYGMTQLGGTNNFGTIFKITPAGELTTLYSFATVTNIEIPYAGLARAANGDLYGTTATGGTNGLGTIFEITPAGDLTTLYNFDYYTVGTLPGALVQGTDGNFYGTTAIGGANGSGTVFEITPQGTLTALLSLGTDAAGGAGLVQGTDGSFYGTTIGGGAGDDGTSFQPVRGGPFVNTLPASGKVGTAVKILGTDLTGAASITFNGTPAQITSISPSEISTTLPAGATTGKVGVTVAGATILSNAAFRVMQ